MEIDITSKIDWLKARIELNENESDYIKFIIKQSVTEALEKVSSSNVMPDVVQRSELLLSFLRFLDKEDKKFWFTHEGIISDFFEKKQ